MILVIYDMPKNVRICLISFSQNVLFFFISFFAIHAACFIETFSSIDTKNY